MLFLKSLPRLHQIILGILVISLLFIIILLPDDDDSSNQSPSGKTSTAKQQNPANTGVASAISPKKSRSKNQRKQPPLTKKDKVSSPPPVNQAKQQSDDKTPPTVDKPKSTDGNRQQKFIIRKGDTLTSVFKRAGLSSHDVHQITQLPLAKKNLLKIIPNESITIVKNKQGELVSLRYEIDAVSTLIITKQGDEYHEKIVAKQIKTDDHYVNVTIGSNFWNASIDAGLTANQIMQLATIFGWDIDFAFDLRPGDSFALIFEKQYADDKFLRNGNILAARFINQGDKFTAVRYTDGSYYSKDGLNLRKAFLRSPVDFKYVSSRFNPRRFHPVTGQIKAHRGVDYVAAVGTPIKAAGKGRVIKSSYNQYNGNYVFIKHNDTYTTKYLHLKQRRVKQGQTVKQGQIIGTLGATGRVTGAHLHYEFIVNGVHRNPRTVKLPKSLPINKKDKAQFLALSKKMMTKLEENKQLQLAFNQDF